MQAETPLHSKMRPLTALSAVILLWMAYAGLRPLWEAKEPDAAFFAPAGQAVFGLYLLVTLVSLGAFALGLFRPAAMQRAGERLRLLRWPLALVVTGLVGWLYLYSPLQTQLAGAWTAIPAAAALARLLGWVFRPGERRPFGWEEAALTFALYLFPRMVQEARIIYPAPVLSLGALIATVGAVLLVTALLYDRAGEALRPRLLGLRGRLAGLRGWLAALAFLLPFLYRLALGAGGYILYPNIRFAVWLTAFTLAAWLLCDREDRLISLRSAAQAAGGLTLVSAVTRLLLMVVNEPFSLSWSEGNRFYDYSLVFGQDLYQHDGPILNPYDSPGRYALWGVLFLWKGLPIWVHRLWNVGMLTLPSLLLAWLLTRKLETEWRSVLFLWFAAFFIIIAPLHPPFMLTLIITAAFAFHPSPVVRGASLVAASLYAGLSRWTWVLAPGAWGALTDLFLYYPARKGNWFRRLLPTAAMTLLGAGPGLALQAGFLSRFSSGETITSNQPLLWYRLLPNETLGPGVMLLMLFTTGPLLALLIRQAATWRWKLDVFQSLGLWGALAGFLVAGLVISTKIGGGGDLHNLDMYIGTLMLSTSLLLYAHPQSSAESPPARPAWVWGLLLLLALTPVFPFTPFSAEAGYHKRLDLPTAAESADTLERIRQETAAAAQRGEVLFMDQRQLLTFGYIPSIPFVSEYEKKYMMDQAMGGNAAYFQPYYRDLEARRFSLIVTEILRGGLKQEGIFSEENNAWVEWVSNPTLCYYEPILTDRTVGVQLLIPRAEAEPCDKLPGGAAP